MLVVLVDALRCLEKYILASNGTAKALFHETEDWVFSFHNVCEVLGFNPQYIRKAALQRTTRKLKMAQQPNVLIEETDMATKLFVGNLAYSVTDAELKKLFEPHGIVKSVKVISDKVTGRSRGFGFVEMRSADEARTAIEALNGTNSKGARR